MTQKFFLLSKSLLSKIALVAALMSWGGIAAEADTWKISFESQTIPEGWTGSGSGATLYYKLTNGIFEPNRNYDAPTLTTNEALTLTSTQKIIIKAKTDGNGSAYVSMKTSLTTSFSSSSTKFEASKIDYTSDYTTLIIDNLSTGDYYLQFQVSHASIKSIELVDSYDFVLDENNPMYAASGYKTCSLKYTAKQGWNTIILPFGWSDYKTNLFGSGMIPYELKSYEGNILTFGVPNYNIISANKPYLVYAPNATGEQVTVTVENKYISYASHATPANGITFQGTYAPMDEGTLVGKYGVTSEGKLAKGGSGAWMKGYRAYLTGLTTASARIIVIDGDDETTDIGGLAQIVDDEILGNGGSKAPRAYNLQGQQVRNGKKGIYIVNGKKIVVK